MRDSIFADFETTNINEDHPTTDVYLWSLRTSWSDKPFTGTKIEDFLDTVINLCRERNQNVSVYFHNGARFDFFFIIFKLAKSQFNQVFLKDGYSSQVFMDEEKRVIKLVKGSKYKKDNTIKADEVKPWNYTLMFDNNKKLYAIKLWIDVKSKTGKFKDSFKYIHFKDSNLMFPSPLAKYGDVLTKTTGINYNKGEFKGFKDIFTVSDSLEEFSRDVWNADKHIEYVLQDTLILKEFLIMMDKIDPSKNWQITCASTAFKELMRISTLAFIKLYGKMYDDKIISKYGKDTRYKRYAFRREGKFMKSSTLNKKIMDKVFPVKWMDIFENGNYVAKTIREWYSGGITHVNPFYQGVYITDVPFTYADINSSYPYAMMECRIPYGEPVAREDMNIEEEYFTLMEIRALKDMKTIGLPFLRKSVYLTTGDSETYGRKVWTRDVKKGETYFVSSIEYERVVKYYGTNWHVVSHYNFRTIKGEELFGTYVNKWYKLKKSSRKDNNAALTTISKIKLNSLYGKFGENPSREVKIFKPVKGDQIGEWESEKLIYKCKKYIPIAIAITAFARMRLVDAVGFNYDIFAYCDTDSLIYLTTGKDLDIKESLNLGDWKKETTNIIKLMVRHTKQYMYASEETGLKLAYASLRAQGIDDSDEENDERRNPDKWSLSFGDLCYGARIGGQLQPVITRNGRFLKETFVNVNPCWYPEYTYDKDLWCRLEMNSKENIAEYLKRCEVYWVENEGIQFAKIQSFYTAKTVVNANLVA